MKDKIPSKTEELNHLNDIGASLDGFKAIMTRGRCFGLRGRIYKAVVLEAPKTEPWIKWTFCNGMPPATDLRKDIYLFCDWIGYVDEKFAQECEAEQKRYENKRKEGC